MLSFPILMLGGGVLAVLSLMVFAMGGPNVAKASNRRLESVRERHSKSNEVAAQAQLKRILQSRSQTKMDGLAQRLIPNPALLRRRLQQTGRTWTLAQYGLVSLGIIVVVSLLLIVKGLPLLLGLLVGIFAGVGLPHFIVGKLIKRRVGKFTARFPDAIDLMVRGLRSGLPISETLGVVADGVPSDRRRVTTARQDGRSAEWRAAQSLRPARKARIQLLRHPAIQRGTRQPRPTLRTSRGARNALR